MAWATYHTVLRDMVHRDTSSSDSTAERNGVAEDGKGGPCLGACLSQGTRLGSVGAHHSL